MLKVPKKYQKAIQAEIGPWHTLTQNDQSTDMAEYCDNLLPSLGKNAIKEKINKQYTQRASSCPRKIRPKSNAALLEAKNRESLKLKFGQKISNRSQKQMLKERENDGKDFFELNFNLNISKSNRYETFVKNQSKINLQQIKNSNRTLKIDKNGGCLQEINIHNFLAEGSRQPQKEAITRRKQSAFVMKHKFAEIRRSMNIPTQHQQLSSINHYKFSKNPYQEDGGKHDKENQILRLIRYEGQNF